MIYVDIADNDLEKIIIENSNVYTIVIKDALSNLEILKKNYTTLLNCICKVDGTDLLILSQKQHLHLPLVEIHLVRSKYILDKLLKGN